MTNDNTPENPVAAELRRRMAAAPPGATGLFLPMDEIDALACTLDTQEGLVAGLTGGAVAMNQQLDTIIAVLRLFRFYAIGLIALPDRDKVRAFLSEWIDRGDFRNLPWPDLDGPAGFLSNLGYVNVRGWLRRAGAGGPTNERVSDS